METLEPSATLEAAANGHPGLTGDEDIIAAIEQKRVALHIRAEELKAELATVNPELRRYEKAIAAIRGDKPAPIKPAKGGSKRLVRGQTVSGEAVKRTWAAIEQLTEQADDFTQTQVRAITGDSSGVSSLAFEKLRQDNQIRFARQEGQQKIYRLSQASVDEREA